MRRFVRAWVVAGASLGLGACGGITERHYVEPSTAGRSAGDLGELGTGGSAGQGAPVMGDDGVTHYPLPTHAGGYGMTYTPEPGHYDGVEPCSCLDESRPPSSLGDCRNACASNGRTCDWGALDCVPGVDATCTCMVVGVTRDDGTLCRLTGLWRVHSPQSSNGSNDADIVFFSDGSFAGDPVTGGPQFTGHWAIEGDTLIVLDSQGIDMDCPYADYWTLAVTPDCNTWPLQPISSGCTGARRYLTWDLKLTRP